MLQKGGHLLEFQDFRLDAPERRLWKSGEPIVLPPKVFDLLVVLVENHGHLLEKEFLLKQLWPESFVEEANLAVNVSTLRKALGEPSSGGGLIETVPKRGYRFVAEVTEVPIAPIPDPPGTAPDIVAPPSVRPQTGYARYLLAGLVLGIVIGLAAWMFLSGRISRFSGIKKIAVVPFVTLNGDPSQNYLGLGMADALITRLSRIDRIVVTPTSSIMRYAGSKVDVKTARRELMVDAVLEGRVQQNDRRIRLTVDLVSVQDGRTLWAQNFDDMFNNVFALQDSVSEMVATALVSKLTGTERKLLSKRNTSDAEAYSLYMQGQYLASRRIAADTFKALDFFKKAIEKDPNFAEAYAALAFGYINRVSWGWDDPLREPAKAAAMKALAIDNSLPEAHLALGQVLMRGEWDWKGAQQAFDRAIDIDRNFAAAHAAKSILSTALNQKDVAVEQMELACNLDPSSAFLRSDLGWTYYCQRRFQDALINAKKAASMDSHLFTAHREMNKAYLMLGKYPEALNECRVAMSLSPQSKRRVLAEMAQVHALAGDRAQAEAILNQIKQPDSSEPEPTYLMAVAEANLGRKDEAIQLLEVAVRRKLVQAIWMNADPELDSLRSDGRFIALVKKARLVE